MNVFKSIIILCRHLWNGIESETVLWQAYQKDYLSIIYLVWRIAVNAAYYAHTKVVVTKDTVKTCS